MCKIQYEFYHECGHLTKKVFTCAVRHCTFTDQDRLEYLDEGICYLCRRDRRNARPSPMQLKRRRWHFYRRMICLQRLAEEQRVARQRMIDWIERNFSQDDEAESDNEARQAQAFNNGQVFDISSKEFLKPVDASAIVPEGENSCDICGESFGTPDADGVTEHAVKLPCHERHIFGHLCISKWFSEHDSCPTCRQIFIVTQRPIASRFNDIDRQLRRRAAALGFGVGLFMELPRQVPYNAAMDVADNVHEIRRHDVQFIYHFNADPLGPTEVHLAEDMW